MKRGLTGGLGRFSGAVDEGWDLDSSWDEDLDHGPPRSVCWFEWVFSLQDVRASTQISGLWMRNGA